MKKIIYSLLSLTGMVIAVPIELSAKSFLGKISSIVIIFSILAGGAIWIYAAKKRKELEE